jgi:N-acetylmuramoyl-L-alanine amidase
MGEFGRIAAIAAVAVALPVCAARAQTPDAAATQPAAVTTPAPAATPTPAVASAPGTCASRADFRVVLDVGHTPESPGARSARGIDEFVFNLRLGKLINQALLDAGFAKTVLMVTDGPGVRSMYVRMAQANGLDANLLLSIHHDSVPDSFLEKWEYQGKHETFSDRFKGHSLYVSDDTADLKDSLMFASMLGQQLKSRGLQYTPHYTEKFMGHNRHELLDADAGVYRYDTLFVLKKAQMPAALLEAGSIANRDEELQMETPERQNLISASVVAAIDGFCTAMQGKKPETRIAQHSRPKRIVTARLHRRARERTVSTASATAVVVQSSLDSH